LLSEVALLGNIHAILSAEACGGDPPEGRPAARRNGMQKRPLVRMPSESVRMQVAVIPAIARSLPVLKGGSASALVRIASLGFA
jgi:hypothetical protein